MLTTFRLWRKWDAKLLIPVLFIGIMGYIMIFSTTSFKGLSDYNDAYYFIKRHTIYLMVGLVGFMIANSIPIRLYRRYSVWGYIMAIGVLLLLFIPGIGTTIGGATRWLRLGTIQFQPVEIVKFWWAVAVSKVLSSKQAHLQSIQMGVVPVVIVMTVPIACLMMQPDLGNAILTLMVGVVVLLISTMPVRLLVGAILIAIASVVVSIIKYPYQLTRIESFMNPWKDPLGANYHVIQSFTAIGSGGISGFGIGESRLKYFYLPLHYSDFIFSILCEEGGIVLAILVILAFLLMGVRGISIARQQVRYSFSQFLAASLTFFLVFQAMINICVVIGLFPVTGIPLTFISYGGTSLIASLFCLGVLHRVSVETP